MRDEQHRAGPGDDGVERQVDIRGIELGEALAENQDIRILEERTDSLPRHFRCDKR